MINKIHKLPVWLLIILLACMTAGMLYFGLRLKGYEFRNEVILHTDTNSLEFSGHGMAYTDAGVFSSFRPSEGFSLEIVFTPDFSAETRFRSLFSIADGNRNEQLFVGQWDSSLMLMNGDDFSNRRHEPKIYLPLSPGPNVLLILSGRDGSSVYLNNELVRTSRDFILSLPENIQNAHMVIGNSIFGTDPWRGEVTALRFWNDLIDPEMTDTAVPFIKLQVSDGASSLLKENGSRVVLQIPAFKPLLYPSYLRPPESGDSLQTFVFDVFLNFFGFMPLGAVVFLLVIRLNGQANKKALIISLAAGFLLSLVIETTQIWLPSRVSSFHDLLLNSLGALAGGVLLKRIGKF